jgi:putative sigma-54 modulation protein
MMDVVITGRHVVITQALRDYTDEKFSRISRYSFKPMKAAVRLAVEKYRHMAEIILWVDGNRILAKEETDEMYQSIDLAMEKIEQRLRRYKEKLSQHNPPSTRRSPLRKMIKPRPIIARKPHMVSTLSLDDALVQLISKKGASLVFVDDADDKLKLLVRGKEDGIEMTELIIS